MPAQPFISFTMMIRPLPPPRPSQEEVAGELWTEQLSYVFPFAVALIFATVFSSVPQCATTGPHATRTDGRRARPVHQVRDEHVRPLSGWQLRVAPLPSPPMALLLSSFPGRRCPLSLALTATEDIVSQFLSCGRHARSKVTINKKSFSGPSLSALSAIGGGQLRCSALKSCKAIRLSVDGDST